MKNILMIMAIILVIMVQSVPVAFAGDPDKCNPYPECVLWPPVMSDTQQTGSHVVSFVERYQR